MQHFLAALYLPVICIFHKVPSLNCLCSFSAFCWSLCCQISSIQLNSILSPIWAKFRGSARVEAVYFYFGSLVQASSFVSTWAGKTEVDSISILLFDSISMLLQGAVFLQNASCAVHLYCAICAIELCVTMPCERVFTDLVYPCPFLVLLACSEQHHITSSAAVSVDSKRTENRIMCLLYSAVLLRFFIYLHEQLTLMTT